jgi:hypothetical protein
MTGAEISPIDAMTINSFGREWNSKTMNHDNPEDGKRHRP